MIKDLIKRRTFKYIFKDGDRFDHSKKKKPGYDEKKAIIFDHDWIFICESKNSEGSLLFKGENLIFNSTIFIEKGAKIEFNLKNVYFSKNAKIVLSTDGGKNEIEIKTKEMFEEHVTFRCENFVAEDVNTLLLFTNLIGEKNLGTRDVLRSSYELNKMKPYTSFKNFFRKSSNSELVEIKRFDTLSVVELKFKDKIFINFEKEKTVILNKDIYFSDKREFEFRLDDRLIGSRNFFDKKKKLFCRCDTLIVDAHIYVAEGVNLHFSVKNVYFTENARVFLVKREDSSLNFDKSEKDIKRIFLLNSKEDFEKRIYFGCRNFYAENLSVYLRFCELIKFKKFFIVNSYNKLFDKQSLPISFSDYTCHPDRKFGFFDDESSRLVERKKIKKGSDEEECEEQEGESEDDFDGKNGRDKKRKEDEEIEKRRKELILRERNILRREEELKGKEEDLALREKNILRKEEELKKRSEELILSDSENILRGKKGYSNFSGKELNEANETNEADETNETNEADDKRKLETPKGTEKKKKEKVVDSSSKGKEVVPLGYFGREGMDGRNLEGEKLNEKIKKLERDIIGLSKDGNGSSSENSLDEKSTRSSKKVKVENEKNEENRNNGNERGGMRVKSEKYTRGSGGKYRGRGRGRGRRDYYGAKIRGGGYRPKRGGRKGYFSGARRGGFGSGDSRRREKDSDFYRDRGSNRRKNYVPSEQQYGSNRYDNYEHKRGYRGRKRGRWNRYPVKSRREEAKSFFDDGKGKTKNYREDIESGRNENEYMFTRGENDKIKNRIEKERKKDSNDERRKDNYSVMYREDGSDGRKREDSSDGKKEDHRRRGFKKVVKRRVVQETEEYSFYDDDELKEEISSDEEDSKFEKIRDDKSFERKEITPRKEFYRRFGNESHDGFYYRGGRNGYRDRKKGKKKNYFDGGYDKRSESLRRKEMRFLSLPTERDLGNFDGGNNNNRNMPSTMVSKSKSSSSSQSRKCRKSRSRYNK